MALGIRPDDDSLPQKVRFRGARLVPGLRVRAPRRNAILLLTYLVVLLSVGSWLLYLV